MVGLGDRVIEGLGVGTTVFVGLCEQPYTNISERPINSIVIGLDLIIYCRLIMGLISIIAIIYCLKDIFFYSIKPMCLLLL